MYYHVVYSKALAATGAGFDFPYPLRKDYRELQRAFTDTPIFSEAVAASSPPERGLYCAVDIVHQHQSRLAGGFNFASIILLTALPGDRRATVRPPRRRDSREDNAKRGTCHL